MLPTVDQLKATLAGLPSSDRAELAHYLLVSLDAPAADDDQVAWNAELDRRVDDVRAGKVTVIPLESVVKELRERYP